MNTMVPFPASGESRIAVTVLTGFLGSGKTTLLNRLLSSPSMSDSAVIINEFGDVPLDHIFLDLPEDDVFVLPNGCLCCLARDGLEDALLRLVSHPVARSKPPQRIFIETSGLADPAPVAQLVMGTPCAGGTLELASIVTTIDAEHFTEQVERHPEFRKQIVLADRLVFTKIDRLSSSQITTARADVSLLNPHAAHVLAGSDCSIEPLLADISSSMFGSGSGLALGHDHEHGHGITSCHVAEAEMIRWDGFARWFRKLRREHGDQILRVKGVLRLDDGREVAIDGVHHVAYPPRPLERPLEGSSRLVFISQDLPPRLIEDSWRDARADLISTRILA